MERNLAPGSNTGGSSGLADGAVTNVKVNNAAAIARSKLDFGSGLVNNDIATGAAVAYSKLALTGAILNADLAGSIAYAKLVLTGAILNADLAGSIAYSKLTLTGSIVHGDIASANKDGASATPGMRTLGTGSAQAAAGDHAHTGTYIPATLPDAKGDILTATAADTAARLAVGSNDQALVADDTQTTGLKWAAVVLQALADAKGDLLVASAADTVGRLAVGTNGHVLTADSAQSLGVKWAAAGGGSALNVLALPAVNEYQGPYGVSGNSNWTGLYQAMRLLPFVVPTAMTYDRIGAQVDTSGASGVVRLGIYNSDANNRPSALVLDAGTIDASSTGYKEITISQTLSAGLYWVTAVSQVTSSVAVRTCGTAGSSVVNVPGTTGTLVAPPNSFLHTTSAGGTSAATVSGALPSTVTPGFSSGGEPRAAIVLLRRSA